MTTRAIRTTGGLFAAGAAFGAVLAFFLDSREGKRRRHMLRDRTLGTFRRGGRRTGRAARIAGSYARGLSQRARHLREEPKDFDDVTLARKVETEIFRPVDVPKGQINVNAEDGVVYLRGELPTPEAIDDLVRRAERVEGVERVESLLHLPTEAPAKQ
jgi:hypothetical protein